MGKLVSINQTTFIPGRQILDGVLMTNELIDYTIRKKKACFMCKVDFSQAYDCVNWNYLRFMMKKLGFRATWMRWMEVAVLTSLMSVLVKGIPTKYLQVSRGLRHEDPFSPFLFTFVVEGLVGMVRHASLVGLYTGFKISNVVEYSLLQFTDDTILFGDGYWSNLWTLKSLLRGFEMVSGMCISFNKSKIHGIGCLSSFLEADAYFLGCKYGAFPFKFLGF